ncbi:hypothetical protein [Mycobacterium basiliense]|uniref:hypothetical protein n=1 Tax=Mycobacterium basiliense TaxID=2094119 RepID=UPI001300F0E4|nr:hypothetical protein [Mycobacterium basiliense]
MGFCLDLTGGRRMLGTLAYSTEPAQQDIPRRGMAQDADREPIADPLMCRCGRAGTFEVAVPGPGPQAAMTASLTPARARPESTTASPRGRCEGGVHQTPIASTSGLER